MLVVGLTGGIATGKSSVSSLLAKRNVPIIDADLIAREVVQPGTPALKRIQALWPAVIDEDGSLNRKKLGTVIFSDEAQRKKLNGIVHPAVERAMFWGVVKCWMRGEKYCVLDVPLLIEGPVWKWVGKVVVAYCPQEVQLQRLMSRDGSSREDASLRLNSQLPIEDKVKYADYVVDNSGSLSDLEVQVEALVQSLDKQAGWSWRFSWFPPVGIVSALAMLLWRAIRRRGRTDLKKKAST